MDGGKKRILIVDDSAFVRQSFKDIINSDPELEVMGVANDPFFAAKKIRDEVPDAITLDIEMPRMDGLAFLRKIMAQHPIPVVIISSLTAESTEITLRALEYGAVGVINKPNMFDKIRLEEARIQICDAIKAATQSRVRRRQRFIKEPEKTVQLDQLPSLGITHSKSLIKTTEKVIAVGASTGGTEALKDFLLEMPVDCPGIVIVQHMPEMFTKSFAERLNELCAIQVKEAENGDSILRGHALIAPGNKHLKVKRSGARYFVEINEGPLVNRHRPSVDVMFRSVAEFVGANAVGVIMTGMGADGSKGMLEMHRAGAFTIAQDEESCVVFGMPKEAIKQGGVSKILPLKNIANHINKLNF